MEYLLFRLYGPMCSWGDIAVGETRPTFSHPTKSAVLGLVAAALGIKREEEYKHRELVESLGFAVLVESIGVLLVDFHTAQVPSGDKQYYSRKEELSGEHSELNTILSSRDYRNDAVFTAILWERKKKEWGLAEIRNKLEEPEFVPYLGRKSCPIALPFQPQIVKAESLLVAIDAGRFKDIRELGLKFSGQKALYWDECENPGIKEQHVFERRDIPTSKKRWQFEVRREKHSALS